MIILAKQAFGNDAKSGPRNRMTNKMMIAPKTELNWLILYLNFQIMIYVM